jgi:hypothetical protein
MPPSDSQTLCRMLFLRSGDTPVAGGSMIIPFPGQHVQSSPSNSFSAVHGDLRVDFLMGRQARVRRPLELN